ncbi:MAG: 16S rRNA (guanine(966)-N(2))-methyltransferase RsmD [Ignavibacteria bacterium]|nr:16S rRNA (guanine(966)-N(2))-methyltransferase RsmD [Ignavibacteria bacterium]
MRIIGGKFKGHSFHHKINNKIRPTTDFVREAIFNIIQNRIELHGVKVLDLFAGTGILGIEALSRGAGFCHFVDKSQNSTKLISQFLYELNVDKSRYKITKSDVFSFLKTNTAQTTFDIIFSDPPYSSKLNQRLMKTEEIFKISREGTLLIAESSNREILEANENFTLIQKKEYGTTNIFIFMLSLNMR